MSNAPRRLRALQDDLEAEDISEFGFDLSLSLSTHDAEFAFLGSNKPDKGASGKGGSGNSVESKSGKIESKGSTMDSDSASGKAGTGELEDNLTLTSEAAPRKSGKSGKSESGTTAESGATWTCGWSDGSSAPPPEEFLEIVEGTYDAQSGKSGKNPSSNGGPGAGRGPGEPPSGGGSGVLEFSTPCKCILVSLCEKNIAGCGES